MNRKTSKRYKIINETFNDRKISTLEEAIIKVK